MNTNKQIWIIMIGALFLLAPIISIVGTAQNNADPVGDGDVAEKARESITEGLTWLKTRQLEDGSWMGDVGITAFAVASFANAGIHEEDPAITKAVDFILSKRTPDGSFTMGTNTVYYTSVCIVALSATRNPEYRDEVEDAIQYLESVQKDEDNSDEVWWVGGVGYGGDGRPDLSNNQFAVAAFHAASTVYGIDVSQSTWDNLEIFTTRCQNLQSVNPDYAAYNDGGFMYFPGYSHAGEGASYGSMTAAGIWCYILGGVEREDPRVTAATSWLDTNKDFTENPGIGESGLYYYYWTYARAMTLYGEPINNWYGDMVTAILERQAEDGSWVNDKDWWWESYPELATVYAINALETTILPWADGVTLEIELLSTKSLHVFDSEGEHSGDGVVSRSNEEGIPGSTVTTGDGVTKVVIENADAGTYKVAMMEGSKDDYELKVTVKKDGEVLDEKEYSGESSEEWIESDLVINSIAAPGSIYMEEPEVEENDKAFIFPVEKEDNSSTYFVAGLGVLVILVILALILVRRKK